MFITKGFHSLSGFVQPAAEYQVGLFWLLPVNSNILVTVEQDPLSTLEQYCRSELTLFP